MNTLTAQMTIFSRVSSNDIVLFTKHLSIMLKAGIPIVEAIAALEEQTKSGALKTILAEIILDIKNGTALAVALKKHPVAFNQFFVSMIEIGEEAGTLEENLLFLADQLTKDNNLKKKIQSALLYPGLVFFATTIMSGFVSFYVLPSLVDFFSTMDIELPFTTRILLSFASLMKNHGITILIAIIVFLIGAKIILSMRQIKPFWHAFLLKIPVVGKLIAYGQLTRFGRNLGTLLKSGVPISKSLGVTKHTLSNLQFQKSVEELSQSIKKGERIGSALDEKQQSCFPPLVAKMLSVGEKTGNLDETLLYLANFYEEEIDVLSKNFSTIIEPILLLGIGLVVGFIAMAIISPIYELTGSIG